MVLSPSFLLTGAASPDFEKAGAEIRVDSGPIESKVTFRFRDERMSLE
jgi:hypothetical protein